MKITNHGISHTAVTPTQGASPASTDAARDVDAAAGATDGYQPSAELVRILALVQAQPDVRTDRVAQVLQKLQSDAYASAESAEQTADAMLRALD